MDPSPSPPLPSHIPSHPIPYHPIHTPPLIPPSVLPFYPPTTYLISPIHPPPQPIFLPRILVYARCDHCFLVISQRHCSFFLLLLTLSVCVSFGFFYKAPTCSRFLSASFDDARQSLTFLTRRRLSCRQKLQTTRPPRPRQPYLRRPARSRPRSNRLVIVVMRAKSDVMVLRYVLLLLFNHATMENICICTIPGQAQDHVCLFWESWR